MTLTEYEAMVAALPSWQKGRAAGSAYVLRTAVSLGESFAVARDRISGEEGHHRDLTAAETYAQFSTLSGA